MEKIKDPNAACMGCMAEKPGKGPCPYCGFHEEAVPQPSYALPYRTILAGKYLTGRVLEETATSISYLAWDLNQNQKVTIREYFPFGEAERGGARDQDLGLSQSQVMSEGRERFIQAALHQEQTGSLPGDTPVREVFQENSTAYQVLAYVERAEKPLPEQPEKALEEEEILEFPFSPAAQKDGPEEKGSREPQAEKTASQPAKRKKWKLPVFLLCGLLVAAAAGIGIWQLSPSEEQTEEWPGENGNLLQGGQVAFDEYNVYFATREGIYRAPVNGMGLPDDPELLCENPAAGNLICRGEYLYFKEIGDEQASDVWRIEAWGGGGQEVVVRDADAFWMEEDTLYFLRSGRELCRADLSGENLEVITEFTELGGADGPLYASCSLENGRFYCRAEGGGGWFSILDEESYEIPLFSGFREFVATGERLYTLNYMDEREEEWSLWWEDAEDPSERGNLRVEADALRNADEEWIYYSRDGMLRRVQTGGGEDQLIGEDTGSAYLYGSWLVQPLEAGTEGGSGGWRWINLNLMPPEQESLWEPQPEGEMEPESEPETEAEPETESEAETETEPETETQAAQSFDPEEWVYGGMGLPHLDLILNRVLNQDMTTFQPGETVEAENGITFTVSAAGISEGNTDLYLELTASKGDGFTETYLDRNDFTVMVQNPETGDLLLCLWDRYYYGTAGELESAQWKELPVWEPAGDTLTLHFALPEGYETPILIYSNTNEAEAAGPLYLLYL